MKRIFRIVSLFGLTACAAVLLFLPGPAAEGLSKGLRVCVSSVLPTLFPFFVLSELWIALGHARRLSRPMAPLLCRIFHLPGQTAAALLTGAVCGYPVGAQTVCGLYRRGLLQRTDAEHALLFCCNAGPAFCVGILGSTIFQDPTKGLILWAIHLTAAMLLGFLFRPKDLPDRTSPDSAPDDLTFFPALTESVTHGGRTALQVCVFVLFFSLLTSYLSAAMPDGPAAAVLLGALELAGGVHGLGTCGLSQETVFVICAGLLGWGGVCVHCQILSAVEEAGLSARLYWLGKGLHAAVSAAMACLLAPRLPLQVPCMTGGVRPPVEAATLLSSLLMLLILKTSSGKMAKHRI